MIRFKISIEVEEFKNGIWRSLGDIAREVWNPPENWSHIVKITTHVMGRRPIFPLSDPNGNSIYEGSPGPTFNMK